MLILQAARPLFFWRRRRCKIPFMVRPAKPDERSHDLRMDEEIEGWQFRRCLCGLCLAMPPIGKGKKASLKVYWLRMGKPARLLTTKREVDEVASQFCHVTTLRARKGERIKAAQVTPDRTNSAAA